MSVASRCCAVVRTGVALLLALSTCVALSGVASAQDEPLVVAK